jgi:hypothetical protein
MAETTPLEGKVVVEISGAKAVLLGIALIVVSGLGFFCLKSTSAADSVVLSAVAGLLILATSLAGLIVAIKGLGALAPQEALALPSGSVRALLAFTLVIAFMAVVSWSLGEHGPRSNYLVSATPSFPRSDLAAQFQQVQHDFPPPRFVTIAAETQPGEMTIKVYDQNGEQQVFELQKQVITILATVLVAVVGFYFGGKSAADAASTANLAINRWQQVLGDTGTTPSDQPQVSTEGLRALVTQVAALADAVQGQAKDLGDDPLAALQDALTGSADPALQRRLSDAQKALDDLDGASKAAATDGARARDALAGLAAGEADQAKLSSLQDRLKQLLDDASKAKQLGDTAHSRFVEARDAITGATAKG